MPPCSIVSRFTASQRNNYSLRLSPAQLFHFIYFYSVHLYVIKNCSVDTWISLFILLTNYFQRAILVYNNTTEIDFYYYCFKYHYSTYTSNFIVYKLNSLMALESLWRHYVILVFNSLVIEWERTFNVLKTIFLLLVHSTYIFMRKKIFASPFSHLHPTAFVLI